MDPHVMPPRAPRRPEPQPNPLSSPVAVPQRTAAPDITRPRRTMPAPSLRQQPQAPSILQQPPQTAQPASRVQRPQQTIPASQVPPQPGTTIQTPRPLPLPSQSPQAKPIPTQSAQAMQPPNTPRPTNNTAKAAGDDRKRSLFSNLKTLLSLFVFVVTVIIAAMLINAFVFQSYYVDGSSMTPTLRNEDRLIIDKLGRTFALVQGKAYIPKRGDIVVLDSSILDQYGHKEQLIKRIIGIPGDTISIKDGIVTVKNADSPEGFNVDEQLDLDLESSYTDGPIEIKVPEASVYVLGDNRGPNGSFDSRSFGLIDSNKIQGRLIIRIFPFNTARFF